MPYRDLIADHLHRAGDAALILSGANVEPLRDLEIVWVNGAFETLVGLDPSAVVGAPLDRTLGADARAALVSAVTHSRTMGRAARRDLRLPVAAESTPWIELCVEPPDHRGYCIVLLRDVSDRRAREQELAETKARLTDAVMERDASLRKLEIALALGDSAVWEWDSVAGFTLTQRMREWLDRAGQKLETLADLMALVHPDDAPVVMAAWRAHLDEGARFDVAARIRNGDGAYRWIRSSLRVVKSDGREPLRALGFLKNVDEVHRLNERLRAAEREASAASRAKSEFLANMSHELRTPLNGVVGLARALAREPLTPRQQELVALILSSSAHLERLVSDTLDLSRIEAGRLEVRQEPFDAGATLESICAAAAARAADKGLALEAIVAPEVRRRFLADGTRFRQVVTNLLENAIKFTDAGGVTLRANARADGETWRLEVAVEDTGPGVPQGFEDRLFERFEQGDASATRRHAGAGLGLAISRELARRMGGDVVLDRSHRPGARFVATISAPATAPPANARAGEEPPAFAGLRVLVAEDHEINRKVFDLLLNAFGAAVRFAGDGAEAVAAFEAEDFDLILMDLQMPVLDGSDAIAAIRALEAERARPRTPIVAVSARATPADVQAALAHGADRHVAKPIDAARLAAAMAEALRKT